MSDVVKRFGGLAAVRGVSFEVRAGEILGLIGPNGSGKTTMINLISGVYVPTEGRIDLAGRTISGLRASAISHAGVSRTFQKIRLFRTLAVAENAAVALAPAQSPGSRAGSAGPRRGRRRGSGPSVDALLAGRAQRRAGDVAAQPSYGEQRLLEIARALATRPRVAAARRAGGRPQRRRMGLLCELIARPRERRRHRRWSSTTWSWSCGVCDRVVVLDHGAKIFAGRPAKAQRDPAVVGAYLGTDARGRRRP